MHAYMHAWNIPRDLCTYHQYVKTTPYLSVSTPSRVIMMLKVILISNWSTYLSINYTSL